MLQISTANIFKTTLMNRIVLLSFDYPPNNGGISRLCHEIIKELKRRDLSYEVVTNVYSDQQEENITRLPGKRGFTEFRILKYLRKHTSPEDIIICDTWHPAGIIALLSGRRFYILAHGAEFLPGSTFLRNRIIPKYRQIVLKKAAGIIANSHYTANLVDSLVKGLHTHAVPLAIDSDTFFPTKEKNTADSILRICSISRLEKFKGHDFILSVIAKLPQHYRDRIRFEIGGKGPYKPELEKFVHDNGLEDSVSFLGYLPEESMNDFYSGNDLFILCTREEQDRCNVEGFGLVFIEAQACGTAVIGTNAGGIPDAIHDGYGGWLIDQDSQEQLLSLLCKLIDNKADAHAEGAIARRRVQEECSQKQYVDSILKIIHG